jgi:hypothetical protein
MIQYDPESIDIAARHSVHVDESTNSSALVKALAKLGRISGFGGKFCFPLERGWALRHLLES